MKKSFKPLSAALLALAMVVPAQAETLDVFHNTTGTSYVIPIHSTCYETLGTKSQVIYPASVLTAMAATFAPLFARFSFFFSLLIGFAAL